MESKILVVFIVLITSFSTGVSSVIILGDYSRQWLGIGEECQKVGSSFAFGGSREILSALSNESFSQSSSASSDSSSAEGSRSVSAAALILACDPSARLECLHGRCQCKKGYTINHNGSGCLEIARNGLDSPCEEDIQCWKGLLGRMSECNLEVGRCRCYESETVPIVFHQGRCYYGESLGDYCQIDGLCSTTTSNATCRTGICQCRSNFVPSWDKSKCLPIAMQGLNSSCEENSQCEKSQLGTLSECNQERMQCQCYAMPGTISTIYFAGRCYFTASFLGDVCQVSQQCQFKIAHSICGSDGKCTCEEGEGYRANYNNTGCELQQLQTTTATMNSTLISTDNNYNKSNNSTNAIATQSVNDENAAGKPLKIHEDLSSVTAFSPPIGTTTTHALPPPPPPGLPPSSARECSDDSQCTKIYGSFGRCNVTRGKCECFIQIPGPDEKGGGGSGGGTAEMVKCLIAKRLGETCKYSRQCLAMTSNSNCVSGHCECVDETHVISQDGRKCLAISTRGYGGSCDEDLQCIKSQLGPFAICEEKTKTCICTPLLPMVLYENTCHFQRWFGSICLSGHECKGSLGEGAGCVQGKCGCLDGFEKDSSNYTCVATVTVKLAEESQTNSVPLPGLDVMKADPILEGQFYSTSSGFGNKRVRFGLQLMSCILLIGLCALN